MLHQSGNQLIWYLVSCGDTTTSDNYKYLKRVVFDTTAKPFTISEKVSTKVGKYFGYRNELMRHSNFLVTADGIYMNTATAFTENTLMKN